PFPAHVSLHLIRKEKDAASPAGKYIVSLPNRTIRTPALHGTERHHRRHPTAAGSIGCQARILRIRNPLPERSPYFAGRTEGTGHLLHRPRNRPRLRYARRQGNHLLDRRGGRSRRIAAELRPQRTGDRKSTRLNSSHVSISYAV